MEAQGGRSVVRQYETHLAEVSAHLNAHHAKYVVVGATALQLWGTTRATRDVDLLIEATIPNARRVLAALGEVGFGFAREWLADEIVAKPGPSGGDSPPVDIRTVTWRGTYPGPARDATGFSGEADKVPTAA